MEEKKKGSRTAEVVVQPAGMMQRRWYSLTPYLPPARVAPDTWFSS